MRQLSITFLLLGVLLVMASSCTEKENDLCEDCLSPIGLRQATTEIGGAEVFDLFVEMLEENDDIEIIAKIDHSSNAESVEMTLPLNRIILFGNPKLGTPLMQESITTGIDLPQKILITEDVDGSVSISYNDIGYLANRHGLNDNQKLNKIASALNDLVSSIAQDEPTLESSATVDKNQGLVIQESSNSFTDTYSKIKSSIEANNKLTLITELDHQMNAKSVNLELDNCKLLVFGNPELGTPLMKKKLATGIDLPQKVLIFQEEEKVKVAYNDPHYLTQRFRFKNTTQVTSQMKSALQNLVDAAVR